MQIVLNKNYHKFKFEKYVIYKIDNDKILDLKYNLNPEYNHYIIENINHFNSLSINDFSEFNHNFLYKLVKKGCIISVVLLNQKLLYVNFMSILSTTHNLVDNTSFKKYSLNHRFAVWGNAYTHTEFRNQGINKFCLLRSILFLKKMKIKYTFSSVNKLNYFSNNSYTKLENYYSYEIRVLKLPFFKIYF